MSTFDLIVDIYELRQLGLTDEEIVGYIEFFQIGYNTKKEEM